MSRQFFIRVRGQVLGPFDEHKLQSMATRGQFGRMHEVSPDGSDWVRASQYPDLFRGVPSPPDQNAGGDSPAYEGPATANATSGNAASGNPAAAKSATPPAEATDYSPPALDWLYSRDSVQYGPVSMSKLQALVAAGQLGPADLVWTNGMAEWKPVADFPSLARTPAAGFDEDPSSNLLVQSLSESGQLVTTFAILYSSVAAVSFVGGIGLLFGSAKPNIGISTSVLVGQGFAGMISGILLAITAYLLFTLGKTFREYAHMRDGSSLQATRVSLQRLIVFGAVTIATLAVLIIGTGVILAIA